jgi:ankyrin repeat protein
MDCVDVAAGDHAKAEEGVKTAEMISAVQSGDAEGVTALIEDDPALASARDEQGVSAVLHARYAGRDDLVELIRPHVQPLDMAEAAAIGDAGRAAELLAGEPALANSQSADGFAPLHYAGFFGHPGIARMLVKHGADVNAVANNPMLVQPLHSAAAAGRADIVQLLLESGADANARQQGGFIALHAAAQNGDHAMVKLLLDHGADAAAATDDGRTAADIADAAGHPEVVALLTT